MGTPCMFESVSRWSSQNWFLRLRLCVSDEVMLPSFENGDVIANFDHATDSGLCWHTHHTKTTSVWCSLINRTMLDEVVVWLHVAS